MDTATAPDVDAQPQSGDTRFFLVMAAIMSLIILAGFSFSLATGRSSFDVPWFYHLHGVIFMAWVTLYMSQHFTAARGNFALHRQIGKAAYIFIPVMVAAGLMVIVGVAQRNGGPFFFNASEFLISNSALLLCFAVLALWALRVERHSGWHRRLMLCGMAILVGPGLGRLLPMPLFIPYAWLIVTSLTWVFPAIGMIADKRSRGRIHPAYVWGLGAYIGVFIVSMAIAYSPIGFAFTEWLIAGTPGAERPIEAFLPPGLSL